ncbi:MAG: autotransporter outer membrane beta-barrel domain-containing protein [Rhodospirillales bacterium]|nr:autotransporter outer membrane beta-barrel domain-containing protein [Rhodospirillales bacterium]
MKIFKYSVTSLFVAVLIASSGAIFIASNPALAANTCNTSGYTYDASCSGNSDAAGNTVSSSSTVVTAANATAGLVLNRVSSFRAKGSAPGKNEAGNGTINLLGFGSGAAAGEHSNSRFGLWGNGNFTRATGSASDANFDSNLYSGMLGFDYRPSKKTLFGIGFGYETSNTDTEFNRGEIDGMGYTITPYISIGFNNNISLDAVIGYTKLDYDMTRLDPLTSTKITGSSEANRNFGSINLVVDREVKKFLFGFRVGSSFIHEKQDAYVDTDGVSVVGQAITVGSGNVGLRVGYDGGVVHPYLGTTYSYDYNDAGGAYNAKNTFGVNAGISIDLSSRASLSIEGAGSTKKDVKTASGSGTIRLGFEF